MYSAAPSAALVLLLLLRSTCGLFRFDDVRSNHTLDLRLGRKQLESGLRSLESHRFREALREARAAGYKLKGFYHTSTWRGGWRAVMEEQLRLLDGKRERISTVFDRESASNDVISWGKKDWASLLESSDHGVHVTVAGQDGDLDKVVAFVDDLGLAHRNKLSFFFNKTLPRGHFNDVRDEGERKRLLTNRTLSEGESATWLSLVDYCEANRQSFVYYLHLKGACCTRKTEKLGARSVTTWREAMNAFVIEFPSICLRALVDGYDSCGFESQDGHYSGNFFWARCDSVVGLVPFTDRDRFDAYKSEYAIFRYSSDAAANERKGLKCGYSTYNCHVDHYKHECPRSKYLHKLLQYSSSHDLPPNFDGLQGETEYSQRTREWLNHKPAILSECKASRSR